ncbi:MAG TPA: hypothetical protein VFR41_12505 [Acidimicrobiia bacterium]|nr:hypothetical protein [Acidimicrobiia bacterium]
MRREQREERGAALVLAIAFTVIVGALAMAMTSSITSSLHNRKSLNDLRNKEYAADGAIQYAASQVRGITSPGPALAPCGAGGSDHYNHSLNGVAIRVDCKNAPSLTLSGFLQRNVIFSACVDHTVACSDATTIIRAQINFQAVGTGAALNVTRTWIQTWSVLQ